MQFIYVSFVFFFEFGLIYELILNSQSLYLDVITPGGFGEKCQQIFRPDVSSIIQEQKERSLRERGMSTMTPV